MKFENIQIGDSAVIEHKITHADIDKFVNLTGDDNKLHVDPDYAKLTSFQAPVVHGMLTASFISTIIGKKIPGDGSLWYEQNLKFLHPVRIGQTIRVVATVIAKSNSLKVITLSTKIYVDLDKLVIDGEAKVKLVEPVIQKKSINPRESGAVIVTGAARGIGAAVALELSKMGFPVVINYNHSKALANELQNVIHSQGGECLTVKANVSNVSDVSEMVKLTLEKYGKIYGVVNNACPAVQANSFDEMTWEEIEKQLDVQIKGSFNICKSCLPHLLENGNGCIVNIGSTVINSAPPLHWTAYSLAKSALYSFSKSLAAEYAKKNIRINMVSPGMTYTDMSLDFPESVKSMVRMKTPNKRLAQPDQVADMVAFLFSDKATHIVGQNIRVCGGAMMV